MVYTSELKSVFVFLDSYRTVFTFLSRFDLLIVKGTRFFLYHFCQTLTAHNICLTHIRPSILIYANALGYVLSTRVEFVMQFRM